MSETLVKRWHISPKTGRAEKCSAEVRACPFGKDHWDSAEEANFAAEIRVELELLSPPLRAVKKHDKCGTCGTTDPTRLIFDRSRSKCNSCAYYSVMLANEKVRQKNVIEKRIKELMKKQSRFQRSVSLDKEGDQQNLNRILDKIKTELLIEQNNLAAVKDLALPFTASEYAKWRYAPENDQGEFKNGNPAVGGQCCYCEISDLELYKARWYNPSAAGGNGAYVFVLGIDRSDSKLSYNLDNMRVCCYGCNSAKSGNRTHEEMQFLAPYLKMLTQKRVQAYDNGRPFQAKG